MIGGASVPPAANLFLIVTELISTWIATTAVMIGKLTTWMVAAEGRDLRMLSRRLDSPTTGCSWMALKGWRRRW